MNFTINKRHFYEKLSVVSRAISVFSPLPAFSGVKIDVSATQIVLTGSDSDISIRSTILPDEDNQLTINDIGSIVIEAKYILEIVRKIEGDVIEIEILDDTLTRISGTNAQFKINGMKSTDYPAIDFSQPRESFQISSEVLKEIITQTCFATSDRETRPVLTGVNFSCQDHQLQCVATDSYRLAKKLVPIDATVSFNITIPSKSLQEVLKSIGEEENVTLYVDHKKAQFLIDHTIIQTRLIDGAYPETSRLIPADFSYELRIDSRELLNAIDRASFIKNDGVYIIKFSLDGSECILSSSYAEVGSSMEVLSNAEFKGDHLNVSCNGRYVFEALKALKPGEIVFHLCGEMKPFTIHTDGDDSVLMLVVPLRTYA